jgi:hypothetical protein
MGDGTNGPARGGPRRCWISVRIEMGRFEEASGARRSSDGGAIWGASALCRAAGSVGVAWAHALQGWAISAVWDARETPACLRQQGMGEDIWACADIGQALLGAGASAMAAHGAPCAIIAHCEAETGVRPEPQKSVAASSSANKVVRRR